MIPENILHLLWDVILVEFGSGTFNALYGSKDVDEDDSTDSCSGRGWVEMENKENFKLILRLNAK